MKVTWSEIYKGGASVIKVEIITINGQDYRGTSSDEEIAEEHPHE